MKRVRVKLGNNSYDILIGRSLLAQAGTRLRELGFDGELIVITDPRVKRVHGSTLMGGLTSSDFKVTFLEVPEGEEQKSLETAGRLYHKLTQSYAERTTPILALGGGVIGDLSGFVAATYLRGVPLIQIPTTLLAQVDSSIGGKVAVNHGTLKNRIGAFYQPRLVISDTSTLKTLPTGEITDGLAEVIKYGIIRDAELFTYIEDNLKKIKSLDDQALETIVYRSARIKAKVVAEDERDFGLRNILNYGHTIGHAIESVSDFKVRHGEAVAIGMIAAAKISRRIGWLDTNVLNRITNLITKASLPTELPKLELKKLVRAMKHDKKVLQGKLRFVLPRTIGEVFSTDEVSQSLIEKVLVNWNEKA
jgi:3-dehydroquinate synthase